MCRVVKRRVLLFGRGSTLLSDSLLGLVQWQDSPLKDVRRGYITQTTTNILETELKFVKNVVTKASWIKIHELQNSWE